MDKLIFLYDKLITGKERTVANLPIEFVSFAQIRGRLFRIEDSKRRRIFATLGHGVSTRLIYGALFRVKNYEEHKHKLHSYYNNSIPYTGHTMAEDLYDFVETTATPIRFEKLQQIEGGTYAKGKQVTCSVFIGNRKNKRINYNLDRKRYYKMGCVDKRNFIALIKERNDEKGKR